MKDCVHCWLGGRGPQILDGPLQAGQLLQSRMLPWPGLSWEWEVSAVGRAAGRVQADALCTCLWFEVGERAQGQEHGRRGIPEERKDKKESLRGGSWSPRVGDSQG